MVSMYEIEMLILTNGMVVRTGHDFQDIGRVTRILSPPDADRSSYQVLFGDSDMVSYINELFVVTAIMDNQPKEHTHY